jgi:hypothetical protein
MLLPQTLIEVFFFPLLIPPFHVSRPLECLRRLCWWFLVSISEVFHGYLGLAGANMIVWPGLDNASRWRWPGKQFRLDLLLLFLFIAWHISLLLCVVLIPFPFWGRSYSEFLLLLLPFFLVTVATFYPLNVSRMSRSNY